MGTLAKIMAFMPDTAAGIQRETRLTYSHVLRVIREMEANELITIRKSGRCLNIEMTERGKKLKNHLSKVNKILAD